MAYARKLDNLELQLDQARADAENEPFMNNPEGRAAFRTLAPAGFYIALRVGFAFPVAEHNALPDGWVDLYTREGFMFQDPVMRWVYSNFGWTRWSEMRLPDPRRVMMQAQKFGLRYGVAISLPSTGVEGQRSFGSFARSDREFTDEEIHQLESRLRKLHELTAPPTNLTEAEIEVLRMMRSGQLIKEISAQLGVTDGAIKQRIKSAKAKLRAKTASQAVSTAVAHGLI
ncbi:LuxR family transcriptional regulator [Albidovulum inexpectatum]|uniref:LuxR family transcriptional regulator n=2 Tax=Albidovulum inexpectatum TaxID=196587 RepID=A0A2S5JJW7_9RHOB|nr:LuxR family transcriptional regulator [Albidovulum inexpectatum]